MKKRNIKTYHTQPKKMININLFKKISIVFFLFILLLTIVGCKTEAEKTQGKIEDGIYLLKGMEVYKSDLSVKDSEAIIQTNSLFKHNVLDSNKFYLIDIKEYVPLKIKKKPKISANLKPKIEGDTTRLSQLKITLLPEYARLLEEFTTKNINKKISIVIGGKAITKHVIREPIIGGNLQISRCTDEACTVLLSEMENNIVD